MDMEFLTKAVNLLIDFKGDYKKEAMGSLYSIYMKQCIEEKRNLNYNELSNSELEDKLNQLVTFFDKLGKLSPKERVRMLEVIENRNQHSDVDDNNYEVELVLKKKEKKPLFGLSKEEVDKEKLLASKISSSIQRTLQSR